MPRSERFGPALKEARERGGWSIDECAKELGVTYDCWYKWETGQRWPTSEQQLDAIAAIVRSSASRLLKE